MNLIDLYYKLALFGTNTTFIILVAIFILFFVDKKIAINSLIFAIFSIFINQYLKAIWQVPMDPSLNKVGWAFPSGHTQLNIVFWGSVLWQIRNIALLGFLVMLLPSSYFAMVDAKYHTWHDIGGGIVAGFAVLAVFALWYSYGKRYIKSFSIFIFIACSMIIALLPEQNHKFFWLWFYLGCLTPIIISVLINKLDLDRFYNKLEKWGLFIASSTFVALISLYESTDPAFVFIQGFCIAFSVFFLVPYLYDVIKGRLLR